MAEVPLAQAVSETERSALVAQQKLKADVDAIEAMNQPIRRPEQIGDLSVLNGATRPGSSRRPQDLG